MCSSLNIYNVIINSFYLRVRENSRIKYCKPPADTDVRGQLLSITEYQPEVTASRPAELKRGRLYVFSMQVSSIFSGKEFFLALGTAKIYNPSP